MNSTPPTLAAAIQLFISERRQRCCDATIYSYTQQLADWQDWRKSTGHTPMLADVTLTEVRGYFAQLSVRCMARTVRNHYRTLKALFRWLEHEDLLRDMQRRIFSPGRITLPRIVERERPAVTADQVDQLIAVCSDDEEGYRNRAMLLMLWESGARVFELARLTQASVDLRERQARIVGKGNKEGYIFWGPRTAAALLRYMRMRRGPRQGPLYRGVSSRNNGQAMTTNAIRLTIKRLADRAGVTLPKGAVVHGFRHGCARELRRRGCTKEEVRDILRHEDLKTTQHYLGIDVDAPRAAHRRVYG